MKPIYKSGTFALLLILFMACFLFVSCGKNDVKTTYNENKNVKDEKEEKDLEKAITIVYTNDIHSYIDNVLTDDKGETKKGLRLSSVKALTNELRSNGERVILADCGDEIQGTAYGAFSQGEDIIELLNATGYQVATPGNHDFDFTLQNFFDLMNKANYPYISCNLLSTETNNLVLPPYTIIEENGVKVGFIGITTPTTFITSAPTYFQDSNGHFLYKIIGSKSNEELYKKVQHTIDSIKDSVDYVVALGHIGVGDNSPYIKSTDIIKNVTGLDAFIDGHSHSTIEETFIKDKDQHEVLLTQAAHSLQYIGVLNLSKQSDIHSKLINDYSEHDEEVATLEDQFINNIEKELGKKIASSKCNFYINNPDKANERLIRSRELNLGDLVADSIYWYLNIYQSINCDVAITNGGGIRSEFSKGDITALSIKSVCPFGNVICMIEATGQQILDALEMGVTKIGEWDTEWDCPAENGGFLHVSGLRYTIDSTIDSSILTDRSGVFLSTNGDYRVKDVEIYNKESMEYEPLILDKTYRLAGANYLLLQGGNGLSMFDNCYLFVDYLGLDSTILSDYLKDFKEKDGVPIIETATCPLKIYKNFDLDYESPYGANRIKIIME